MLSMPPTRIWLAVTMTLMTIAYPTYSQHLSSARAGGLSAFTAVADGVSSLDWNPAGLINLTDWELEATSFYALTGANRSLSFDALGIGKHFVGDQAGAFRISPGIELRFDVPSTIIVGDSVPLLKTTFDKRISYSEKYALGYSYRVGSKLSLGLSAHFLEEKISDTKYSVDPGNVLRSTLVDYSGTSWSVDWGLLWRFHDDWRAAAVSKNLFRVTETPLADEVRKYGMTIPRFLRLGIAYEGVSNLLVAIDGDTQDQLRIGTEWKPTRILCVRGGLYVDASSSLSGDAASVGLGVSFDIARFDLGYLKYFSQVNRGGVGDLTTFQQSTIGNIEYNKFASDRFTLTATIQLGRTREILARIEYVEMLTEIFPASRAIYAFRPVGKARVRNTSAKPIEAKVSFYVDRLMDAPTETKPHTIAPGGLLVIPFYAVFNEAVGSISSLVIRNGDVYVTTTPQQDFDDHYQTRVLVHGKNDWNGEAMLLKYFVTPDEPDVVKFTRALLISNKSQLDTVSENLQSLEKARILFNGFSQRLLYIDDPKKSEDYVQYPAETLTLHGGDCDDMSVCYSALLASVGIATAFVDVIPPNRPDQSHIYLMFDSGIEPKDARLLGNNPKRYFIRKNDHGKETAWIPIETTVITKGFDEAWSVGAGEFYDEAEVKLGILNGWIRLIDTESVY